MGDSAHNDMMRLPEQKGDGQMSRRLQNCGKRCPQELAHVHMCAFKNQMVSQIHTHTHTHAQSINRNTMQCSHMTHSVCNLLDCLLMDAAAAAGALLLLLLLMWLSPPPLPPSLPCCCCCCFVVVFAVVV